MADIVSMWMWVQSLTSFSGLSIWRCRQRRQVFLQMQHGSRPAGLWCSPAAAGPICPLAWKRPYAQVWQREGGGMEGERGRERAREKGREGLDIRT